jgi:hypothetical protein
VGIGFGTYTVAAFSRSGLVSRTVERVTLTEADPTAVLELTVGQRPLQLEVRDDVGNRIPGASAFAVNRLLSRDNDGLFAADTVPAGERIEISAPGFIPTCVLAGREAGSQVARLLPQGSERARITLLGSPGGPVGMLEGLPGSECSVGLSGFRLVNVSELSEDQQMFEIIGLPRGQFWFRVEAQAPAMLLDVPGPGIRYAVPVFCRFCS